MPWGAKDAMRHTKKASSGVAQRQWAHIANAVLEGGASEGSAIRQANAVVARRSYQEGTDYVPETGDYTLHEGEMVLPQEEARLLRRWPVTSLLTGQPAAQPTNEDLIGRAGGMPAGTSLTETKPSPAPVSQPDASGWRHAVHPGAEAAVTRPTIPATRLTPVEAPEIGAPMPGGAAMWAKIPPTSLTDSGNLGAPGAASPTSETGRNVLRILAATQGQSATDTTQPRSLEEEYRRELATKEPTRDQFPANKLPIWRKALGLAAATLAGPQHAGPLADRILHGGEQDAERKFETAHGDWENKVSGFLRTAKLRDEDLQNRNTQSEIDARNRPKTERPENLDREAYDYYVGQGMTPADARKRVLQDAQSVKPERTTHTSPFEAFAYGSPEEKKAAQDYLEFEKRMGARYRTANEFEEKYKLFKEDPETYRAMFGDRSGGGPDRATATKMLNYFDRRRREINQDFTLDDAQKQEQLKDIENLEKPFMDAVQPGAADGGKNGRVEVIHPNGQRGTIPRSQLGAAKKKGYREATQQ